MHEFWQLSGYDFWKLASPYERDDQEDDDEWRCEQADREYDRQE